ncbi:hypothetical protein SAMN02746065_103106 [Desulfocicer vacuolatum DSM 3385]|uniref:Uncharacterized protein n=1 Tax=Desulfocicer vacuolatum DSM 3385 TaxID=1121400 RepID=A0A1W1ZQR0_9BACT|nr:hypothetical protein [Desulfocicer vacuolatum]SMC50746.1 hypothetical protein SAMN02746065_103106 [Desulfocicer vacuolatum DSM 3385]
MKYFPIKIVVLCILLTPVFYTGTISLIERSCVGWYQQAVEQRVLGDTQLLINGSMGVSESIEKNINLFLESDVWVKRFGLQLDILVFANEGDILYPFFPEITSEGMDIINNKIFLGIARHNYTILKQGLTVKVSVRLHHGTLGANLILAFYVSIAMGIFWIYYRRGVGKSIQENRERKKQFNALLVDEKAHKKSLGVLKKERTRLLQKMKDLRETYKDAQKKATITEEEMFDEIVSLENQLNENVELQKEKTYEIELLKDKLKKYEQKKGGQKKQKGFDFMAKRFSVLYKNIDMNRRAITGFLDLNDELQIKAEEVVHQLNENSDNVVIKRKVFAGKKHKSASFEVLFAYNGRLYFRQGEDHRIEILVIGTKNSQDKDMDFLHRN